MLLLKKNLLIFFMVVTENVQREVTFFWDFEKMKKPGLLDNIQYRVSEAAVHYHNEVQGMTKIWYITLQQQHQQLDLWFEIWGRCVFL